MSATDVFTEPSLFDHASSEPASEPASEAPAPPLAIEPVATGASSETAVSPAPESGLPADGEGDRKRLAEQLHALKRKEFELRRALAAAEHPELAESIRLIEGRAFAVSRAEAKLAQGFSKSESRRRDVIEKKLASVRAKRAELDSQIGALEAELGGLGSDRLATFGQERQQALEQLLLALGTHESSLRAAGLDPASLVPEIDAWLPELEALAGKMSSVALA